MFALTSCLALALPTVPHGLNGFANEEEMSLLRTWFHVTDLNVTQGRVRRQLLASGDDTPLDIADELHLRFTGRNNKTYAFTLTRASVFDEETVYTVNKGGESSNTTEPPLVPVYETEMEDGVWAQANILEDGSVSALIRDKEDLFIVEPASLHSLVAHDAGGVERVHAMEDGAMVQFDVAATSANLPGPADADDDFDDIVLPDGTDLGEVMRGNGSLPDEGRRLSQLNTLPKKPYGRLSGCEPKPKLRKFKLGVIADRGFVQKVGGTELKALNKIAAVVSRANAIYREQAGLTIVLVRTIINVGTGVFRHTGPNHRPSKAGRNKCGNHAKDGSTLKLKKGASYVNVVYRKGHVALLQKLSSWVTNHGGDLPSAWHLFTDCFPAPGVVGVAWQGAGCRGFGTEMTIKDTGSTCSGCNYRLPNGNKGKLYYGPGGCPQHQGRWGCYAHAAITSWTKSSLWRIFAHEVSRRQRTAGHGVMLLVTDRALLAVRAQLGHNLRAPHTFGKGGIMDYTNHEQFYDDGKLCKFIQEKKASCPMPPI